MLEYFRQKLNGRKWERWMKKEQKSFEERRDFCQKKLAEIPPFDVPEEPFLISEYGKIRIVDNLSEYLLPSDIDGYELGQEYDDKLPRHIISYQEALHLADIVALVRDDDPEINIANAIRHYLGVTHSYHLKKLGLFKEDLNNLNKIELIKYMQMSETWEKPEMINAIRHERNTIAIKKNIQHELGGRESTTGYISVLKNGELYSVWVSNPKVHGESLTGPLPVLVNVSSMYYSNEEANASPSYEFIRHYGRITFPMFDFAGCKNYYDPF